MVDYWWDVHDGHASTSPQAQLACSRACSAVMEASSSSSDDASMASTCVHDEAGPPCKPNKLGTENMLRMMLACDDAHENASPGMLLHLHRFLIVPYHIIQVWLFIFMHKSNTPKKKCHSFSFTSCLPVILILLSLVLTCACSETNKGKMDDPMSTCDGWLAL